MGSMSHKTRDSVEPKLPAKLSGYLEQDRLSTFSEVPLQDPVPSAGSLCFGWETQQEVSCVPHGQSQSQAPA